MNNTVQIKKYRFTFHDYGGFDTQGQAKQPEEHDGLYHFDQNYCYFQDNQSGEANDTVLKKAFDVLKDISEAGIINKKNSITYIDYEAAEDKSYSSNGGKSPYELNFTNMTVLTGNYVGVIRYRKNEIDATVEIGSRFDKTDQSQLFLSYLLSKAFDGLILPKYPPDTSHKNMWELLLAFVFSSQLKDAYRQGLYKSYQRFEYNDPKVKGKIDVNRHIKYNTPFVGNIAYSVREHTFDTPILHLILHAFERLEKKYPAIMESLYENDRTNATLPNIKRVLKEVTSSFNFNDVQKVLLSTNKRINHPYFNKYEPLRKTCRMILKDMGINVFDNDQDQQVYGILINMNWLWENFAGKEIFTKCGFRHIVKESTPLLVPFEDKDKKGIGAVKKRNFDFIKEKVMVADAKYKTKWAKSQWDDLSNDVYQVLSYMLVSGVKKGGVAFPQDKRTDVMKKFHLWTDHKNNDPYAEGYYFYTIPLIIPDSSLPEDEFKENIEESINALIKDLIENLNDDTKKN